MKTAYEEESNCYGKDRGSTLEVSYFLNWICHIPSPHYARLLLLGFSRVCYLLPL